MNGEFTNCCNESYTLTVRLEKRQARLKRLLVDMPLYYGQTSLSEIDDIISYYRDVQAAKAKVDETCDEMRATEADILMFMRHFNIPPGTILNGKIPGELAYEIWSNENDTIYINKTKDLAPEPDDLNVIEIRLWNKGDEED
jgi:hypothetical protein